MRVTQRTVQENWVANLQKRLAEMNRLNQQIGSGKSIGVPSDDPSGAGRIVRIGEIVARNQQYLKNIEEALSIQGRSEDVLNQIYDRVVRAKSLAVEGANAASDPVGGFASMAAEVSGIKDAVLEMALSKYQDHYLFSGTAAGTVPYGTEGGAYRGDSNFLQINLGNGQSVAVNLPGDRALRETQVRSAAPLAEPLDLTGAPLKFQLRDRAGSPALAITLDEDYTSATELVDDINAQISAFEQAHGVQVNIEASVAEDGTLSLAIARGSLGGEIVLEDDSGSPGALEAVLGIQPGTKNVFGLLGDLEAALTSGDQERVGNLLGRLDRALEDLVGQWGKLGSRQRNLEFAKERTLNYNITSEALRDQIEGVDLAEAVTRITSEEQAYQTALAAGARVFNISILDYLS